MTSIQVPQQVGRPLPPDASAGSAATRHLCAAAYLDDEFRDAALREVYYQPKRVVAPSYGFHLIPVLWHCLRARNLGVIRDAAIVAPLLFTICVAPLALVSVAFNLFFLHIGIATWRLLRDAARRLRSGGLADILTILVRAVMLLFVLGIASVGYLVLLLMLFAWAAESAIRSSSDDIADTFAVSTGVSIVLMLIVFALPVAANLWRQAQVERLVPGTTPAEPQRSARFDQLHWQQQGNTVIYSGYNPFVGSGEIVDTWGFALRLVRDPDPTGLAKGTADGEREFEQRPFTAQEIISYVAGQLAPLGRAPEPERCLPGLTVEDRVFLSGTEVSQLWPVTEPDRLAQIISHPTTPARHYLACQVVSWRGELVTSVYIHFAVQGRSLYLEVTTAALPPCQERYRIVDQVDGTGIRAYLRAAGRGLVDTPRTVGAAPFRLLRALVDVIATSVQSDPAANAAVQRGFDYGARTSVRELGAAEITRNHTQTQDIHKYKRIIERRAMAATLDFLVARGVDTSEFRQRAANILNFTAINNGSGPQNVGSVIGQQNNQQPAPAPAAAG